MSMMPADVFATGEFSDLKKNEKGQLFHPLLAVRSIPDSNRREIKTFNFNQAGWDRVNELKIPIMNLRVSEMYVEFNLTAETSQSDAVWEPTSTWLTLLGASLLYKNTAIINVSEPEATLMTYLEDRENVFDSKNRVLGIGRTTGSAAVPQKLYLSLNHLVRQSLSQLGPISAYDTGDFTIRVALRPQLEVLSGDTTITAPNSTMVSMKLVCIGSRVPAGEVAMIRHKLREEGLTWNFLRSHRFRDILPATNTASTATVSRVYSSITGNISQFKMLKRDRAAYNAVGTTAKNNVLFRAEDFYGPNTTLAIGKTSSPFDVYGRPFYPPLIDALSAVSKSSRRFIGLGTAAGLDTPSAVDTGIIECTFCQSSGDMSHGTSSGSYPVKADFRTEYVLAPNRATTAEMILDTVVWTHARGVITGEVVAINTSA